MKTFIWKRKYEVLAANAETVEQARILLKPVLDALLDPELENTKQRASKYLKENGPTNIDYRYTYYCSEDWWEKEIKSDERSIKSQKEIILNEPDVIINENQGMIFIHYE